MTNYNCPVCGADSVSRKDQLTDMLYGHKGVWESVECSECTLHYIFPQPSDSELSKFYDKNSYYSFNLAKAKNTLWRIYRRYSRRLMPKKYKNLRMLDYGCGDGEVLNIADEMGADVFGLEFGESARRVKDATGFDVYDEAPENWMGTMDFIRSNHSLEHVKNPVEVLTLFKNLAKDSTSVIKIGVPNCGSWSSMIFGKYFFYRGAPIHTVGFSPKSISRAAKEAGLVVDEIKTIGGIRGWIGSLIICICSLLGLKSKEPSTKLLIFLSPLYIFFILLDQIAAILRKAHLLEVTLRKNGEEECPTSTNF